MKLTWPTDRKYKAISCYWEDSKDSEYYKKYGWKHNGIDFAAQTGSDLFAITDITCYNVLPYHPTTNPWGNCAWFTIDGSNDSGCVYGHLSTFGNLKVGDKFKAGDLLPCKTGGDTVETGYSKYSSGGHLHLGVWLTGYKDPNMNNYSDILGLFMDNETIEVADTKMNPDYGKAYFIKDNKKHWSPDLLTFYAYGLVPEDILRLTSTIQGEATYWTGLYKHIKEGDWMNYNGSVHQKLFDSMRKKGVIKWPK